MHSGSPLCEATGPRRLSDRVERESAPAAFRASGPEEGLGAAVTYPYAFLRNRRRGARTTTCPQLISPVICTRSTTGAPLSTARPTFTSA